MSELEIAKVFESLNLPQPGPPPAPPTPPQAAEKDTPQGGLVYFPISGASTPLKPPRK